MSEEEKLLGDQVEEILEKIGADKLAKAYEAITGNDCGCKKRKEALNRMHQRIRHRRKKREKRK